MKLIKGKTYYWPEIILYKEISPQLSLIKAKIKEISSTYFILKDEREYIIVNNQSKLKWSKSRFFKMYIVKAYKKYIAKDIENAMRNSFKLIFDKIK